MGGVKVGRPSLDRKRLSPCLPAGRLNLGKRGFRSEGTREKATDGFSVVEPLDFIV